MWIFLFSILCALASYGAPTESLSQWGVQKKSREYFVELETVTTHSYWTDGYSYADVIMGFGKEQIYSFGYKASLHTSENRRDAWFLRYDFLFGEQNSLSFKYIHENWYWLSSGKESIGLSFNSMTSWNFYYTVGYYFRWLKQSWDRGAYAPFTFSTDDKEGFVVLVLGWKFELSSGSFWTVDFNNRDSFSYYSSDNWAVDFKYYLPSDTFTISILAGFRLSGLFGLAPYPATGYGGLGVEY